MADEIVMKRCPKCNTVKPASDFCKSNTERGRHGLQSICKACKNLIQKEYRKTQKGKDVQRRWELSPKGRLSQYKTQRRKYQTSREKISSHCAVQYAIKMGRLPPIQHQRCIYCGQPAEHYHHKSYERKDWLNVEAVCWVCHRFIHINDQKHQRAEQCSESYTESGHFPLQ